MDVDTTRTKGSHEQILDAFGDGEADILLGTQMIAKGLDFPNITLVGVFSADTILHLPDFRSAEKTFQLLTQVSGRAGRHDKPGEVLFKRIHQSIMRLNYQKNSYMNHFMNVKCMRRHQAGYPPYYYLALVQVSHEDVMMAAEYAEERQTVYVQIYRLMFRLLVQLRRVLVVSKIDIDINV